MCDLTCSEVSSTYAHWKFGMPNSELYCRHIAYSQEDQSLNNGKVLRKVDKDVCVHVQLESI